MHLLSDLGLHCRPRPDRHLPPLALPRHLNPPLPHRLPHLRLAPPSPTQSCYSLAWGLCPPWFRSALTASKGEIVSHLIVSLHGGRP